MVNPSTLNLHTETRAGNFVPPREALAGAVIEVGGGHKFPKCHLRDKPLPCEIDGC